MAYVYCHFKEDDMNPFYVGMGKTYKRPFETNKSRNVFYKNIVKKHGVHVEMIVKDIDWDIAQWWEIRWIKALRNAGYELSNATDGGDGLRNPSEETRKKISKIHLGNKYCLGRKLSDETKNKISIAHEGKEPNWEIINKLAEINKGNKYNLGKTLSESTRNKMSLAHVGNKYNLGRKHTNESRKNMSIAQMGKKMSPEAVEKTVSHHRKPVICLDDGLLFKSAMEAGKHYGLYNHCKVAEVCRGVRKTAAGRIFKYIREA
jgi:NUMOD3 motif